MISSEYLKACPKRPVYGTVFDGNLASSGLLKQISNEIKRMADRCRLTF